MRPGWNRSLAPALLASSLALGCGPNAEIAINITADTSVPRETALDEATLKMVYDTCGGFNGDCTQSTLLVHDIRDDPSRVVINQTVEAGAAADDVMDLSAHVYLRGEMLSNNQCILFAERSPSISRDGNRIVFFFSGKYESKQCPFY